MKILQGYVENRTKEIALASVLLTVFFVTRTFKVQVHPLYGIDLSSPIVLTAASMFSWPYTLVFSFSTLYMGSNPFGVFCWLISSQVTFFLSKLVGRRWAPHIPVFGEFAMFPLYGMMLQALGLLNFNVYLVVAAIPELICIVLAYVGGLFIWGISRVLRIVD